MSNVLRDDTTIPKQNEAGPNYFAYYKHLILDLLSDKGNCSGVSTERRSEGQAKGSKVEHFHGSGSYFTESICEGLSGFKKERLVSTLSASARCLNKEADEMLDCILATLKIDSILREKEQLPSYSKSAIDEDLKMGLNRKRKKAHSTSPNNSDSDSISCRKVYNNIQSLQGKDEVCHEDVEKYTFQLLAKLDNMEENLEEYMDIVVSKCRPMTHVEKHRLGKMIRKLPEKALNRVAEILRPSNFSSNGLPENIFVNLEEEDDVKLWRIYYYVELILKNNNI